MKKVSKLISCIIVFALILQMIPLNVANVYAAYDKNSDYFRRVLQHNPSEVVQAIPPQGFNSYKNFVEKFVVAEKQNAYVTVGRPLEYKLERDKTTQEIRVNTVYSIANDPVMQNAVNNGGMRMSFSVNMNSWKEWNMKGGILPSSNSPILTATVYAVIDGTWRQIAHHKVDRNKTETKGRDINGNLVWFEVPQKTTQLNIIYQSSGSDGGYRPCGEFRDAQVYFIDQGKPSFRSATGNGNIGSNGKAEISVEFNEHIRLKSGVEVSTLTLDTIANKFPYSTETKNLQFRGKRVDSDNGCIIFEADVPSEVFDTYDYRISENSMNALCDKVIDNFGNTASHVVGAQKVNNLTIDNVDPRISDVKLLTPDREHNAFKAGDQLVFGMIFDEKVDIFSTQITLNNGVSLSGRTYSSNESNDIYRGEYNYFTSGVGTLKPDYTVVGFHYTISEDDDIERLDIAHENGSMELSYSVDIRDNAGNTMKNKKKVEHKGSHVISANVMIDTVPPVITIDRIDDPSQNPPGGGSYAIYQVEVLDSASGIDEYTESSASGRQHFVSQAFYNKQDLMDEENDKLFGNTESLPAGISHYLYIKSPESGEVPVVISAVDKAGNTIVNNSERVHFDSTAPAVLFSHSAVRNDFDDVNLMVTVTGDDGSNGIGCDMNNFSYKWIEPGENPDDDSVNPPLSPSNVDGNTFTVSEFIEFGSDFNKILCVKSADKNNNKSESYLIYQYPLQFSTDFSVEIDSESSLTPKSEYDIAVNDNTDKKIRVAWTGTNANIPADAAFVNVYDPDDKQSKLQIGNYSMQDNFGGNFSGNMKLYIQWYDNVSNNWIDYSVPRTYAFSNEEPSLDISYDGQDWYYYGSIPIIHVDAFESADRLPVDAANSYIEVWCNDEEIGTFRWIGSATSFDVNLNSIDGLTQKLQSGTITISAHVQSFAGKTTVKSLPVKIDATAPEITNYKDTIHIGYDDLKLKSSAYYDDIGQKGLRMNFYTYWLKLEDLPVEAQNAMSIYYVIDNPEYNFTKYDPDLKKLVLNVDDAINLKEYKNDPKDENTTVQAGVLYHREAAVNIEANKSGGITDYFADRMVNNISGLNHVTEFPADTDTICYAPINIPINDQKVSQSVNISMVCVDELGNFQRYETTAVYDNEAPAIYADYSNYVETITGPIDLSVTAQDEMSATDMLMYSEDNGNTWLPYAGEAITYTINADNYRELPMQVLFKDEQGKISGHVIVPSWFITQKPEIGFNWVGMDDAAIYSNEYTSNDTWQDDSSLPFEIDSKIPLQDGFVEFEVHSVYHSKFPGADGGVVLDNFPIYIAFADENAYGFSSEYDSQMVPENWIMLEDGIDTSWLKVSKQEPDFQNRITYHVKMLVKSSAINNGINQLFIKSANEYGLERTIGTLNTMQMKTPYNPDNSSLDEMLLLINTGTIETELLDINKTEIKNPVLNVTEKVEAALNFNKPAFVTLDSEENPPNDINEYSVSSVLEFHTNGEHIVYWFDSFGEKHSTIIEISGIDESIYPVVKTDPATYTNAESAILSVDASDISDMYIYDVIGVSDGVGEIEDIGGIPMYKLISYNITENTEIFYQIYRTGSGATYPGSKQIDIFDHEPPTADIELHYSAPLIDGKTNDNVTAMLKNINDNTGAQNVSVMAVVSEEGGQKVYADSTVTSYTFRKNGSYTFVLRDIAGNIKEFPVTIDCIDPLAGDNEPPGFKVTYYSQNNQGTLSEIGFATHCDENGFVYPADKVATGFVLVQVEPVDISPVTADVKSISSGVEAVDGTNLKFKFSDSDAVLILTLRDSAGNETELKIKADCLDNKPPEGFVRYEKLPDGSMKATLIVSDNFSGNDNLIFEDSTLEIDDDGNRFKIFSSNGSYTFVVSDEVGNKARFEAVVKMFDDTAPLVDSYDYAPRKTTSDFKTNKEVLATVKFSEAVKECRTVVDSGGGNYQPILVPEVRISTNGDTAYIAFKDNANILIEFTDAGGNKGYQELSVDYIDIIPPKIHVDIEYDKPKAGYATATIVNEENGEEIFTNENTLEYIFDKDGSYPISVYDAAGNVTTVVVNIDQLNSLRVIPTIVTVIETTEMTKGPVKVTFTSDKLVTYENFPQKVVLQPGMPHEVSITHNGVYSFTFYDSYRQMKNIYVTISNIDNIAPVFEFTGPVEQTFFVNDPEFTEELLYDFIVTDNVDGVIDIANVIVNKNNFDITTEGEYYVDYEVSDSVGNIATAHRKIVVAQKGIFDITIDDSVTHKTRIATDGQKIIVNSKICTVEFSNGDIPVTAKYKAGICNTAKMKLGTKPIINNKFEVSKSGWYTIMFQDAFLNRQVVHIYVSAGD